MASTRRLTAILAADVAGYSRLMGVDEEGTHERLKAHLGQLVDPKIKEHRGRTVKNTGDGLLAEFASVVDAVRCAVELQRAMGDRNAETPEDKRINFRVGVNLGDVIAEEDDIYGDGVNIAARLEALAEPGGICISRVVRDQIRDKLPYPFEDRGEQSVKNIARSVRVYALRPEAVAELPAASVPVPASQRSRSPVSYFWNARGPPPINSPACSWVRPSFLRMRRISSGASSPSARAFSRLSIRSDTFMSAPVWMASSEASQYQPGISKVTLSSLYASVRGRTARYSGAPVLGQMGSAIGFLRYRMPP
jgi:class 3 adenylate cyclase